MQAADFQNALAANDNSKRLTDVPKFYGNSKDTLTARDFLKRLEQAAAIGNWNDKRKCAEFCHLLHSEANGFMTMTLKKAKVTDEDWAGHKSVFLDFFDVKGTAKLNFFSLHEMKQSSTEKVRDFWTKVQLHMDRIKDSVDVQEQIDTLEKQDFPVALVADIVKESRRSAAVMQDFYEKMIFIAGLNADIRVKVMEATPKFAYDALRVAIATETLILDKKDNLKAPIKISAIKTDEPEDEEEEEEDEAEASLLNSLNAIRIQKGKTPFKRFSGNQQRTNGNGNGNGNGAHNGARPKTTNGEPMKCRYCKKSGHMQKEGYKRIKENGAMITAQGKQYKANEVTLEKNVGAITASGYPALNSVRTVL